MTQKVEQGEHSTKAVHSTCTVTCTVQYLHAAGMLVLGSCDSNAKAQISGINDRHGKWQDCRRRGLVESMKAVA